MLVDLHYTQHPDTVTSGQPGQATPIHIVINTLDPQCRCVSIAELQLRKMRSFLLLAATCGLSAAAPQWLASPYLGYGYAAPAAAVVTGNSVPVSVGGYKAVAGSNGDLAGPVHEVPGLVPALAIQKQESSGDVSLSTGTGAVVPTIAYYGKREAEADPALVYSAALPYAAAAYPYAAYPYTYAVPAVKPLTLKSEVVATGAAVPVSVGGYKAVAGNNGELKVSQNIFFLVSKVTSYLCIQGRCP